MARLLVGGLLAAVLAVAALAPRPAGAAQSNSFRVDCTATRSHVAVTHRNRLALTVQNVGTVNVYVGSQDRAELTLHVASTLNLTGKEAQAGVHCQTDAGSSRVDVLEVFE